MESTLRRTWAGEMAQTAFGDEGSVVTGLDMGADDGSKKSVAPL